MLAKDQPNQPKPTLNQLLTDPRILLAFGFGSGMSPIVPGTVGSLVGLLFYYLMAGLSLSIFVTIIIVSFLVGCYLCDYAAKKMGVHDHPGIVWDEFVGLWITFIAVEFTWQNVVAGFLLFRLFDMVKPWPIGLADRYIHGGIGIMIDDVIAAAAAWVCLQILIHYDLLTWMAF